MPETRFFLGTNGPEGFFSIYDEITNDDSLMLYILKGGPGCGKSSFMRKIAEAAKARGYNTELICCSGDPDSLDAVIIPGLSSAFLDGTAPHISEPKYPGASGLYVDLGRFYDTAALREKASEIAALTKAYKQRYKRAYSLIKSAYHAAENANAGVFADETVSAVIKRAEGIARREFGRSRAEKKGNVSRRFLSAFTCRGKLCCTETLDTLCSRVYLLDDLYGLADMMLRVLCEYAVKAGYDITLCPDPLDPRKLQALLVPALSVGFITADGALPEKIKPYRHVRLDAMADARADLTAVRRNIKASRRQADMLQKTAQNELYEAKRLHDALEAVYNPHVDFSGVYAEAERYEKLLLKNRKN